MLIFLDTEFTDFIQCDLISIGMVDETGRHSFYAERTDFNYDWCNDFVRSAVWARLGEIPEVKVKGEQLSERLRAWFTTLPRKVVIACDSRTDWDLLLDALDGELPANVVPHIFDLRNLIDTTVFNNAVCRYHDQPNQPWHHALHDAKAHRDGWLAWMIASKPKGDLQ